MKIKTKTLSQLILLFALVCQVTSISNTTVSSLSSSQASKITFTSGGTAYIGGSVTSIGDVNGDGVSDFLISGYKYASSIGGVAVIYGVKGGLTNIDLGTLKTSQGYLIQGSNLNDKFGMSVAALGDVNGDKISDFIIGAPGFNSNAGIAYVIYGRSDSTQNSFGISALSTSQGFSISGSTNDYLASQTGNVVAKAGDFDGDGINDILLSCSMYQSTGGASFLVYGLSGNTRTAFDLSSMTAATGIFFTSTSGLYLLGSSIAPLGDINSDSKADIIIGSSNPTGTIVVYGRSGRTDSSFSPETLTSANGFSIYDSNGQISLGKAVAGEGDVNGDGKIDIAITAESTSSSSSGVISLSSKVIVITAINSDGSNIDVSNLQTKNGFQISSNTANNALGASLSIKGDVSGDKIDDIIMGAPGTTGITGVIDDMTANFAGSVFVVFGKSGLSSLVVENSADAVLQGSTYGTMFGAAVAANNGDFNNDGSADLIVGAPKDNSGKGEVYVVYGGSCTAIGSCPSSKGLSGGAIAGIVIGSVAGASLIGVGTYFLLKKFVFGPKTKVTSIKPKPEQKPSGSQETKQYVELQSPNSAANHLNHAVAPSELA